MRHLPRRVSIAHGRDAAIDCYGATVMVALVASFVNPSLAKKRMLYVPDADGAANWSVALLYPAPGVFEPLK
jgi:hypothetical protein